MRRLIFFLTMLTFTVYIRTGVAMAEQHNDKTPSPVNTMTWLAGQWRGEAFGGVCEESWTAPSAGTMVGTYKQINKDTVTFYEIMTITADGDGAALKVKHFNADLTAWEEKDGWTLFPFIEATENEIRFDGLVYRRLSPDTMQIVLRMKGKDGSFRNEFIDCHRVK